MSEPDVLVVGAGPAGSTVAFELARSGHDVVVAEEHGRVGHPVQCAGLVSERVLELAGTRRMVRGAIYGASVFSPSLRPVSFRAAEPRGFVIDRARLDIELADRAARAGAQYRTGWRFDGLHSPDNGWMRARFTDADGARQEIRARAIVGADGVASAVARAVRIRRPVEILPAFEAEFPESAGDPDRVEVYLGRALAPGLFGWWIPDFDGGARVGVAARADGVPARVYFDRLVDHLERRFGTRLRNPTGYIVSGIPIGEVPRISTDRALLVGDAAAQVKPLSGGGIFTGMRAATLAAETLGDALERDDLSARSLVRYDVAWRKALGDEFQRALYLRRLFLRLSDAELERLVAALADSEMTGLIVAFGDIDFPTHLARKLLRQSPALLRLFPKAIGAFFSSGAEARLPDLDPGPRSA